MRLGKLEKRMLQEIETTTGDVLVGFLMSGRSASRAYRLANECAQERGRKKVAMAHVLQQRKRVLANLEKKGLIRLVANDDNARILTSKKGNEFIDFEKLVTEQKEVKQKWDGTWSLVMFDVPMANRELRYRLSHMLQKIGFIQVQFSNYVYPYPVRSLEQYLKNYPKYGEYCHVFHGSYVGDDSKLRKQFKL